MRQLGGETGVPRIPAGRAADLDLPRRASYKPVLAEYGLPAPHEKSMAGHSQFKNIMHRKGRQDAARAKLSFGEEVAIRL